MFSDHKKERDEINKKKRFFNVNKVFRIDSHKSEESSKIESNLYPK